MTEVPEHLLRRGKERRAALSGEGGSVPPASSGEAASGAESTAVEAAAGAAVAAVAEPVEAPPAPIPPYVAAALRRPKVPKFAIPVLAALPVWALVYAGVLAQPSASLDPQLTMGQTVFNAQCSGCHGSAGEGGTGRPLNQILLTFPKVADHLAWVENGDPATPGTPYGDPARPGGQRISGSSGYTTPMPAFKDKLTADEIAAVVRYERVEFAGEAVDAEAASGATPTAGK